MCSVRSFTTDDMFEFSHVNLDMLTETYNLPFYLRYLAYWPEYFLSARAPSEDMMGYIMGKAEGDIRVWIRTFSITLLVTM